jgi:hypothetical protein
VEEACPSFLGGAWSTYPFGRRHRSHPIHFSLSPTTTPVVWWPVGGISGERSRARVADGGSFLPCSKNRSCSHVAAQLSNLLRPCVDPPSRRSSKSRRNLASAMRRFSQGGAACCGARGGRSSSSRHLSGQSSSSRRSGGAAPRAGQSSSSRLDGSPPRAAVLDHTDLHCWSAPTVSSSSHASCAGFSSNPRRLGPTCVCANIRHRGG